MWLESSYHLEHDIIGVSVGHQASQRASSGHSKPSAVVYDDHVSAALLDELGRETDAGAGANNDVSILDRFPQSFQDSFAVGGRRHGHGKR